MEYLISRIYHEKQQEGSMLCAQHALNGVLQGNYFTAPDLSAIAASLDTLEQSYDDNNRGTSTNMDDTGFFSVQVLENALHVWGLNLLRWRSEALRPYQDRPHTQLGFILNLNQHWFTLRRFGATSPNPDTDPGQGHWFNLNSFLPGPEWVGNLYLSMVLQQAEEEGYSVFVVMQSDPEAPLALPRTDADDIASTIPEQTSAPSSSTRISTTRTPANTLEGFEGDDVELQAALQDMDLQAALQASLMAHTEGAHSESGLESPLPLPVPPPLMSNAGTRRWRPMASGSQTPTQVPSPAEVDDADDPVAASMARNRSIMQRMRLEQETALRENYEEIDMEQLRLRQRQRQEEEDLVQRAIVESEALHPRTHDVDDDAMVVEDEAQQPRYVPAPSHGNRRVYDDEDEELQAALRASLEDVPEGYQPPAESPPPRMVPPPTSTHEQVPPVATNPTKEPDADDEGSETSSIAAPEEEQISMEEMRKRRLAKFGM